MDCELLKNPHSYVLWLNKGFISVLLVHMFQKWICFIDGKDYHGPETEWYLTWKEILGCSVIINLPCLYKSQLKCDLKVY